MNSDNASHLRHELRTPINHLIGYAELLLEDEDTSGPLVTLLGEVRELARQVLTVTAGVLDADASVSTVAVEALHGLVGELEECVAPLPAASGPGQAGDVERIVAATKRLREMVDSLQIPPGGDGPGGAAGGSTTALVPGPDGAAGDDGTATILVVDDDEANREVLARRLVRLGYRTVEARNGVEALEILASAPIDLVLLDVMMPEMDGYAVLERRRHDPALRDIPVIMISALDQVESIVRCIEQGAEDYLPKPFDPVLLQARVGACLEKKRLHDREKELLTTVTRQAEQLQAWNQQLEARVAEKVREVERLNELRRFVAPQLADVILSQGDELLRSHRREITVVFCDLRGFTAFAETGEPEDVMAVLDEYHGQLGPLVFEYGGTLEQFAGDGMMVFFNDPVPCEDPAWRAVQMAVAMRQRARQLGVGWRRRGHQLDFGVGIAVGYATCGRIGFEGRFDYAAIGTVTNLAARLCAEAKGGQVLVSQRIFTMLEDQVAAESVGELELKGIARPVPAYNVTGLRAGA